MLFTYALAQVVRDAFYFTRSFGVPARERAKPELFGICNPELHSWGFAIPKELTFPALETINRNCEAVDKF